MKLLEYYYNIIYYFFYRGFVISGTFIGTHNPFILLIYFYYKIPSVKQKWLEKGITNPYRHHIDIRIKKIIVNEEFGLGTMYGGGVTIFVLGLFFLGIYHIFKHIFFPTYEDVFSYTILTAVGIAWIAEQTLSWRQKKGENYIKKFNKIKGFWRIKWATITALSPFFVIWFSISTSTDGTIGRYLLSLSGNYEYTDKKELSSEEINDLIYKNRFKDPNIVWDFKKREEKERQLNAIKNSPQTGISSRAIMIESHDGRKVLLPNDIRLDEEKQKNMHNDLP
ncbi:hypothetical protein [sulfur-oxidizing endosymbiont of Gigantopelta aegis]|uniref:hypothetical protein n=1 Tax=sulfur-oxidizing endosymbiont of Gigantopelta aegis TaxID=2794934 RepID=UPI0018DB3194|nr:hypothetical protein [sulfur-oxidizing endosymbiont of Gigantopelta aegis]